MLPTKCDRKSASGFCIEQIMIVSLIYGQFISKQLSDLLNLQLLIFCEHIASFKILATTSDFQQCGMCDVDQQRLRSACAYALSDQSRC